MARAQSADRRTPPEVLARVLEVFDGRIDLDPCASLDGSVGARVEILHRDSAPLGPCSSHDAVNDSLVIFGDGLVGAWSGNVYLNCPFDGLALWMRKARAEAARPSTEVLALLPARTDTRFWHEEIVHASRVCSWRGRIRFEGTDGPSPFPTAFAYFGHRPWAFEKAFHSAGHIYRP